MHSSAAPPVPVVPLPPSLPSSLSASRSSTPTTINSTRRLNHLQSQPAHTAQPSPWQRYNDERAAAEAQSATSVLPPSVHPVAQTLHFQHANSLKYSLHQPTKPRSRLHTNTNATIRQETFKNNSEEKESTRSDTTGSKTARAGYHRSGRSSRPGTGAPSSGAHSARSHRPTPPLASIDPAWSSLALPSCLEPRGLLQRSIDVAEHELDWIHSGVFTATRTPNHHTHQPHITTHANPPNRRPNTSLVKQLQQFDLKPRPYSLELIERGITHTSEADLPPPEPITTTYIRHRPNNTDEQHSHTINTNALTPFAASDGTPSGVPSSEVVHSERLILCPSPRSSAAPSPTVRPASALLDGVFDNVIAPPPGVNVFPPSLLAGSALLRSLDSSYDADWADVDAALVEREQRDIQDAYEREKQERRRRRKRNKVNQALGNQSSEEEDEPLGDTLLGVGSNPVFQPAPDTNSPTHAHRRRASSSASPLHADRQSSPRGPVAGSPRASPRDSPRTTSASKARASPRHTSAPLQSQFAAYDPSIDVGIDINALPLAFQLPASNQATAAAATQGRPTSGHGLAARRQTHPTSPPSMPIVADQQRPPTGAATGAAVDPSSGLSVDVGSAREAAHAMLGTADTSYLDAASGMDVEEASAAAAFDLAKASAQPVLERFDKWQEKVDQQRAERREARRIAMSTRPNTNNQTEDAKGESGVPASDSIGSTPRAPLSPVSSHVGPSSPRSHPRSPHSQPLKQAGSARIFFVDHFERRGMRLADDAHEATHTRQASGDGGDSRGAPSPQPTAATTSAAAPRTNTHQPPAIVVAPLHRDTIKLVSLRTSGWGSQVARQELQLKHRNKAAGTTNPKRNANTNTLTSTIKTGDTVSAFDDDDDLDDADDADAGGDGVSTFRSLPPGSSPLPPGHRPSSGPVSFARAGSNRSHRSWSNRIKRSGIGESAGRGSGTFGDERNLPKYISVAERQAAELEAQRAHEREILLEAKEHELALSRPVGFVGLASPPSAYSARKSDEPIGRTMLPDPRINQTAGSDHTLIKKVTPIDTPHYMRQIDRSVMSAVARPAVISAEDMMSSSPPLVASNVFPNWLWRRPDFQSAYSSVPFETCLRVLNLFPDERTELHLSKLREWILAKAIQHNQHATTNNNADDTNTPKMGPSARGSRHVSRQVSRSPSRAALHNTTQTAPTPAPSTPASSLSHSTHTIHLPPSSTDYLSSLPRPILDGLLRVMKTVTYPAGEVLWQQGRQGDLFGILVQGKIQSRRVEYVNANNAQAIIGAKPNTHSSGANSSTLPPPMPSLSSRRASQLVVSTGHRTVSTAGSTPRTAPVPLGARPGGIGRSISHQQPRTTIAHASVTPTPTPAPLPNRIEYIQTILPGAAFGHEKMSGDIEASNHAQVQRKRTLRLWHLLRLSVRRVLRDADQLYTQLSRLTYGGGSGSLSGASSADPSSAASSRHVTGGGSGSSGGGGGGGLSEVKIRKESLVALTDVTVFTISFYAFASIEFEYQQLKLGEGIRFLSGISFFKTLVFSRLRHLYSLLLPRTLTKNEIVWRQGSPADEIVFIEQGTLSLSREVVVTESHRHPMNHISWLCDETTFALSSKPFAQVGARDYIGEDLLDSPSRDFTIRCKSDTAKIWYLRKRYIHLLSKYRHLLEDVSRVRRSAAAATIVELLTDKYPHHHAAHPFPAVDWMAARASAQARGEEPLLAPELHHGFVPRSDAADFLYLDAGALYVRFDPSGSLLRSVCADPAFAVGDPRRARVGSQRMRPRKVSRVYTAPSIKDGIDVNHRLDSFTMPDEPIHAGSHKSTKNHASRRVRGDRDAAQRLSSFHQVVTVAVNSPEVRLRHINGATDTETHQTDTDGNHCETDHENEENPTHDDK